MSPSSAPANETLRLATWNCAHQRREKLASAVQTLGADLVVLTEVPEPAVASPGELWVGRATSRTHGLSVVSLKRAPIRRAAEFDEELRFALPIEVGGKLPFQLLGIWMAKEPVHYVPNLVAILRHYQAFIGRAPTVVLGDFNASQIFDVQHPRYPFSSITAMLSELGL